MRNNSLSSVLLYAVEKTIEGTLLLDDFYYYVHLHDFKGPAPSKRNKGVLMAVRRLRMKGYIEAEKTEEGKTVLRLTTLGKGYLSEKNTGAWDGMYRIVVWDIPERKRVIRNLLRRKLKGWGFVSWQKSVWVSKRNVTRQLRNLINELELTKWVSVIESPDQELEKVFINASVKRF